MKRFQKHLAAFTWLLMGFSFGDVIKDKQPNWYMVYGILFLILLNVSILITRSDGK